MHVLFVPRAEALADPDLIRTKVNMIPESVDPICAIDIVGIDKQADGGTHVRCTGEVVRVNVVKTESKGSEQADVDPAGRRLNAARDRVVALSARA